jgi:hypothetical protein
MSGGDSGGPRVHNGDSVDCASLLERTILNSPVPAVVSTLKPHDTLSVELRDQAGRKSLVALAGNGSVAGSLTPPSLPKIINCIQQGFKFIAVVIEVRGGRCFVEVRPKAL